MHVLITYYGSSKKNNNLLWLYLFVNKNGFYSFFSFSIMEDDKSILKWKKKKKSTRQNPTEGKQNKTANEVASHLLGDKE